MLIVLFVFANHEIFVNFIEISFIGFYCVLRCAINLLVGQTCFSDNLLRCLLSSLPSSRIVQKIHAQLETVDGELEDLFPVLAGSHLLLKNPTLEFVKYICKASTTTFGCPY